MDGHITFVKNGGSSYVVILSDVGLAVDVVQNSPTSSLSSVSAFVYISYRLVQQTAIENGRHTRYMVFGVQLCQSASLRLDVACDIAEIYILFIKMFVRI